MLAEQAKSQGAAQLVEHSADGGRSGLLVQTEKGGGDCAGAGEDTARPGSETRARTVDLRDNIGLGSWSQAFKSDLIVNF